MKSEKEVVSNNQEFQEHKSQNFNKVLFLQKA